MDCKSTHHLHPKKLRFLLRFPHGQRASAWTCQCTGHVGTLENGGLGTHKVHRYIYGVISSTYRIFPYILHIYGVNVAKYSIHGAYGIWQVRFSELTNWIQVNLSPWGLEVPKAQSPIGTDLEMLILQASRHLHAFIVQHSRLNSGDIFPLAKAISWPYDVWWCILYLHTFQTYSLVHWLGHGRSDAWNDCSWSWPYVTMFYLGGIAIRYNHKS